MRLTSHSNTLGSAVLMPARSRSEPHTVVQARFRDLLWMLAKVAVVLVLPLVGRNWHAAVYLLLLVWALAGPRRALEALTLSWLASLLNPGIYSLSPQASLLRWMILAAASASVAAYAVKRRASVPRAWAWVTLFVVLISLFSLQVSYAPDVSLFKLVSFFVGASTVLLGFHLTRDRVEYWQRWFFVVFATLVVAGLPLIAHPLGYHRNGFGFQGLTNQPQAYAITLAPFVAWLLARLLTRDARGPRMWALAGIAVVSLAATRGRTGALAAAAGLALAGAWWLLTGRLRVAVPRAWLALGLLAVGLAGAWMLMNWSEIALGLSGFAFKGRTGIGESFYASRGFLIESSLRNFREHPWLGIGFGVASDPWSFIVERDPWFGLPISASVEKGFLLVALLEEIGVVGFALFLTMLVALLRPVFSRRASYPAAVLATAALMVNFGESVFFAVGGFGMLVWLLLGWARVMAWRGR